MNLELMILNPEKRQAVGAMSPVTPVLWVYQSYNGRWTVHLEGEDTEWTHSSRGDATHAARLMGESYGRYRLHLQLANGRFCLEMMNLGQRTVQDGEKTPDHPAK